MNQKIELLRPVGFFSRLLWRFIRVEWASAPDMTLYAPGSIRLMNIHAYVVPSNPQSVRLTWEEWPLE